MGIFDFLKKSKNNLPKSSKERKQETEKYLKSINVPFIEHLPQIEEENEVQIRNSNEIAERILILVYLGYVSEVNEAKNDVIEFLKANNLWNKVSEDEKLLFLKDELTEQEFINIAWRVEAVWILLWCIKKIDKIELPINTIEHQEIINRLPDFLSDPIDFIQNSEIRSTSEILDYADLIYRIHWACRDADLNNKPIPSNFNLSIVIERHYAINWVTYYAENWDDITTDT